MDITELLDIKNISLKMGASTKVEAITELTALLKDSNCISDSNLFIKDIVSREAQMSTYCGSQSAIPHAISSVALKPSIALGRTQGIVWDIVEDGDENGDEDGEEYANLIFMLAIPPNSGETQMELLSNIALLLLDDKFRSNVLNANSREQILEIFENSINPNKS